VRLAGAYLFRIAGGEHRVRDELVAQGQDEGEEGKADHVRSLDHTGIDQRRMDTTKHDEGGHAPTDQDGPAPIADPPAQALACLRLVADHGCLFGVELLVALTANPTSATRSNFSGISRTGCSLTF